MEFESTTFTYQARLNLTPEQDEILESYANLMSKIERKLFSEIMAGKKSSDMKSIFLKHFGITARQFNACRIQLEGKMASIKERQEGLIEGTTLSIKNLEKKIKQLEKNKTKKLLIHQKKRRLCHLKNKLKNQIEDQKSGRIRLCFGSKKLFHAQYALEANGFKSHQEWQNEWRRSRNDSFFLVGSKDEISGNQSCTATLQENGIKLRIRLPDVLQCGKYLEINQIIFKYGHKAIEESLYNCNERNALLKNNNPSYKEFGQALSYRFKRDEKGWRIFVSTDLKKLPTITLEHTGAIGIDINANHIALTETDRFGNPVKSKVLALNCYGKNKDQSQALIGDKVVEIVNWAIESKKPLVIEKLNFQNKKTELKESGNPKYARMLSSLAYSTFIKTIKSRAWRFGVKVIEVNPAYTSLIGRIKFAKLYGLSIHQAAALCIARRNQKASERVPSRMDKIPDGKGGHVALPPPVRKRGKHVWTQWRQIHKKFSVVLAAHFRVKKKRSSSRPTPAC